MKKTITALFAVVIILSGCDSGNGFVNKPKTPEELKMELAIQEKATPLSYLSVDATMQEDKIKTREAGIFREAEYSPDGNTIYGTIKNTATIAKFKDVVITVTFYSQTETAIETKDYVIYEFYGPNTTSNFTLKVYPPQAMAKFGVEVKGATAVD